MPSINFYLDKPDASGQCPIFLVYQFKGRKFKHATKEKVLPKYWDKKKQRVIRIAEATEINDILNDLSAQLKKTERELRITNGGYSFDEVKRTFQNQGEKNLSFFEFFDKFIGHSGSTHKHATLQKYRTVLTDLKEFEKSAKYPVTFQSIDYEFQSKFTTYLCVKKKNTQNTVAKKISTIKTLLNIATKANVNDKLDYRDFTVKRVGTEKIYLTNDELFKIYRIDLTNHPKLEKVQDMFCFGCFTGLRYSDIHALKFEEVYNKENSAGELVQVIKIQVLKTQAPLFLPLNKYALSILEKYREKSASALAATDDKPGGGTSVFPQLSIQKMNDYVKELAKLAGIDQQIRVTKYIGTERIDEVFSKYELLASHSARRTFAILSLEKGMRIEVLQKILGHKSIRTTMKYVFIMEDVKMDEMSKAWD